MSLNQYLSDCSSNAILSKSESESIEASINTLAQRVKSNLNILYSDQIQFGSSTRGTILPRKIDEKSDIDYMVIFNDPSLKPQTYLDKLKKFVNSSYTRSEITQDHPTIKLNLNHITFELVPALKGNITDEFKIPGPNSSYMDWIYTNPNSFNSTLTNANNANKSLIKPLIRLIKYWNALNGYIFSSYSLEQHIVSQSWIGSNLKEYFFNYMQNINPSWSNTQSSKDKINRAKDKIQKIIDLEKKLCFQDAEAELIKLLPKYW